jgi:hypothetical protein
VKLKIGGYSILFTYILDVYRYNTFDKYESPVIRFSSQNKIKINGKWEDYIVYLMHKKKPYYIEVNAKRWKGVHSNLGPVEENGHFTNLKIRGYQVRLIKLYHLFSILRANITKIKIQLRINKYRLLVILSAVLISSLYYLINIYFDNYLKDILDKSIGVQSLIIFLTISSFINIFYPFTIRREVNIRDVKTLSDKMSREAIRKEKDREETYRRATSRGKSV